MALTRYRWGQAPEHLKTKAQLLKQGLRPARGQKPVAQLEWYHRAAYGWCVANLYDQQVAVPKRPCSPARLEALGLARLAAEIRLHACACGVVEYDRLYTCHRHGAAHCESCCRKMDRESCMVHRARAIRWARDMIRRKAVIIDLETTGLGDPHRWVCEVGITDLEGRTIFHSLVNPQVLIENSWIHGIKTEAVAEAPTFGEILPGIHAALTGRPVIAYNFNFEHGVLGDEWSRLTGIRFDRSWVKSFEWRCAMWAYTEYCGGGKWPKLPGAGHRALHDCRATAWLVQRMAMTNFDE